LPKHFPATATASPFIRDEVLCPKALLRLDFLKVPVKMAEVASVPVPLDTIPISPEGDKSSSNDNTDSSTAATTVDDSPVTVFHDPDNFNVKHPLMNTWTLWFTKPPSGKVHTTPAALARIYMPLLTCLSCN
jgi:hypothetical protein